MALDKIVYAWTTKEEIQRQKHTNDYLIGASYMEGKLPEAKPTESYVHLDNHSKAATMGLYLG
jgi:hypothetical protein